MKIDINCDLGEGMGNDAELMPYLGSCSIACGGHFGDVDTMSAAIKLAKKYKVNVGAHPSFPDKQNFGRRIMDIANDALQNSLFQQIKAFKGLCEKLDVSMNHIKLHGALYNLAANNPQIAALVLNVFAAVQADVKIYVPYGSVIAQMAEDYFPLCYEAFIDRRYHQDLSLVARSEKNAVITDAQLAWQQMSQMIKHKKVLCVEGELVDIKADTYCLHGDEKTALSLVKYLHQCL
jgi:UPF0271 protein